MNLETNISVVIFFLFFFADHSAWKNTTFIKSDSGYEYAINYNGMGQVINYNSTTMTWVR